ncbi:MAG: response regulator [Chloroflexota bacterium]|nr:response regulator [Chloroflexota bacterium]PLS79303.1 MAG: response regulator [Chloroflexota bacterium]
MSTERRILVVEDDHAIRDFVEMALQDEGYLVVTASDGAAALEIVDRFQPHLILLDMRMPVVDGREFVAAYRQLPDPQARIVVFTATKNAAALAETVAADGVLAKPFSLEELLNLINDSIG